MKYIEGKCPKCGGVLQVPEDLDKLICMYCGKAFESKDMISVNEENHSEFLELETEILHLWKEKDTRAISKAKDLFDTDHFNYTANYILALDTLPKIIIEHKGLMIQFKLKLYEDAMKDYMQTSRASLECINRVCLSHKNNRSDILTEFAEHFIHSIIEDIKKSKQINSIKSSSKISDGELDNYKSVMALFTIPMILELNLDISDEFADIIIETWVKEFPKSVIRKGTFEQLNNGFRKKGFCYITTAVCDTLHKQDDCYELTMFRNFRDNYLLKQEDGPMIMKEYYNMAPVIVGNINERDDSEKIYQSIWKNYLKGCLKAIEAGDDERCKIEYTNMVNNLRKKYATLS